MDLLEVLLRPSRGEKWLNTVIIGGLLSLVPVVNFICLGYLIETIRLAHSEQTKLPLWNNWGEKFLAGLLTALAAFLYLLLPVLLLGTGGLVGLTLDQYHQVPHGGLLGFGLGSLLGLVLLLLFAFIWPMAMAHYAHKRQFGAFFDLVTVGSHIRRILGDYLVILVLFFILQFILAVTASLIPVLGFILSLFLGFYLSLALSQALGLMLRRAMNQEEGQNQKVA